MQSPTLRAFSAGKVMNERENWVLSAGTMERISKLFSLKNNPIRDQRSAVLSNEALTKTSYAQS
jgi:hypothetical protein